MKVDTMRKLDHRLGVPLCFIATGIVKILDFFKPKTPAIKKILLIELSEMGSTIIVDPAMRKAQQHFDAELYFLIFKKNKVSLDLLKTVPDANIFTIREDSLLTFLWDVCRYLRWCRRQKFSATIDLELFSRATALLSGFSGARYRVGFYRFHNEGLYRGEMLTHKVAYNPHIHIGKNFIALVNALISNNGEEPYSKTVIANTELTLPHVPSSPEQRNVIYGKIQAIKPEFNPEQHKLVLINPNASDLLPQRRWMPEHFIALMQKILAEHPNHYVVITGAPAEKAQADNLVAQVQHPRCINFAGQVKFRELIDLYNISQLMVTNDSGPGHFSSVTPLKTFVIFGPETPALYGSLGNSVPIYAGLACSPCVSAANHRKTACSDNICLKIIKPDFVYQLIQADLQ
jgi:ADP-heptose:LPS heptosyltransferase